ncbi:hypothetical protein SALBM311S_01209 [Streptomyces alboniger]
MGRYEVLAPSRRAAGERGSGQPGRRGDGCRRPAREGGARYGPPPSRSPSRVAHPAPSRPDPGSGPRPRAAVCVRRGPAGHPVPPPVPAGHRPMRRARSARRTRESPPAPTLHGTHIGSHVKTTSSMWSWGTAHRRPDTPCSSRRSLSSSRRGLIALASGGRSSPVMTGTPPCRGRGTVAAAGLSDHAEAAIIATASAAGPAVPLRPRAPCRWQRPPSAGRRPQSQFRGLPKPAVGGALANVEGGRDSSRGVLLLARAISCTRSAVLSYSTRRAPSGPPTFYGPGLVHRDASPA